MISVCNKKWIQSKVNNNSIEKIKQDFRFSDILSRLIVYRNFTLSEIYNIENNLEIENVFKNNKEFNTAADLLITSIKNKEYICILGDYDVDGSAATSLVVRFFNQIKQPYFYYIPDRETDGYGASKKLFKKLILKKPSLVIMLDCGSSSNEAIDYLNQNKIKSIIIDHHEVNIPYPKSNVLINPKKNNGYQEYDYFCSTTLTYFFLYILIKKIKSNYKLSDFLIYVLLATVCDVMPMRNVNKIIAKNVLKKFQIKDNLAFKSLFPISEKKNRINIIDLGYLIGPIINSGGRLGKSNYATELLTSDDTLIIEKKSNELIELNNKRKQIEEIILNDINFEKIKDENKDVIIYYNKCINEGLIGIIAARLKDYFNKPSLVITNSNNILKGSGRSTSEYNLGNLMKKLLDNKIIEKGGGHNMAAGFSLLKNNLKKFEDFILKDYIKVVNLSNYTNFFDSELSCSSINKDLFNDINKLGPFGNQNQIPIFLIKNLKIIKLSILNKKHISVILKPKVGASIKSICFNSINTPIAKYLLSYKKEVTIIAQIHENIWNNKKSIQLNIKDIII